MKPKINLIFLPLLKIAAAFVVIYSFLHWLLIIEPGIFIYREEIINFVLPLCLPVIPLLIWFWPRLRLIKLKRRPWSGRFGFTLLATYFIAAVTITTQFYIAAAAGKITTLQNIDKINQLPATRYYSVKKYFIDFANLEVNYNSHLTGRYKKKTEIELFFVCPVYTEDRNTAYAYIDSALLKPLPVNRNAPLYICDGKIIDSIQVAELPKDSIKSVSVLNGTTAIKLYGPSAYKGAVIIRTHSKMESQGFVLEKELPAKPKVFFAANYSKTVSNSLSKSEWDKIYQDFFEKSMNKFNQAKKIIYFKRVGNSALLKNYTAAVNLYPDAEKFSDAVILEPQFESFEQRAGNKLLWVLLSTVIGVLLWLLMLKFQDLDQDNVADFLERYPNTRIR